MYFLGLYVFKYIEVTGEENILHKIGVLIISNHCTFIDSFLIRLRLINLKELFFFQRRIPYDAPDKGNFYSTWISSYFMYLLKNVPVKRGSLTKELLEKLIKSYCKILEKIGNLILFPEGGRTKKNKKIMDVFKTGVAKTILIMTKKNKNFEVLPVYLDNIREMLPEENGQAYFKIKRKIKGKMIIGKPLSFCDICIREDISEDKKILLIKERGRNAILALKP